MADDDERNNGDGATPSQEPVDLSSRRQQRQRERAGDDFGSASHARWSGEDYWSDSADELEEQAREMVRAIRENAGELGERVRQAVAHARELWEESAGVDKPIFDDPHPDEPRARALMRRWVKRDFLVDPDLPTSMSVIALRDSEVWRVELRERGETRSLAESIDPYTGVRPPEPGPILPLWDYSFPAAPDIEAGERRERLAGGAMLGTCERCHGSGRRACPHCAGKGFVTCPECRGRGRKICPRCRGRGRIADAAAERRARAAKSYFQVHAERLAQNAVERLADLSERLRQDYGAPLPPSAQWAPTAPASGETIPCPDCKEGTIACSCNQGKLTCPVCHGTELDTCPVCHGAGKVIRYQEIARRFDTRIRTRLAPPSDPAEIVGITENMLRSVAGETVWEGPASDLEGPPPEGAPSHVWQAALELKRIDDEESARAQATPSPAGERRALWRRATLMRAPITRLEYAYAGRAYEVIAIGRSGEERFWAESFPPRWHRVTRFFQAVARDLNGDAFQRPRARYTEERPTIARIPIETGDQETDAQAPSAVNGADGVNPASSERDQE